MRRFRISPISLVVYPLYLCFFGTDLFLVFFSAVFIHELGHIAVILLTGQRIERVAVTVAGLDINRSGGSTYLVDAAVAVGGPVAGIIAAAIAAYLGYEVFYAVSLIYSVLNLLPVIPLDGGIFMRSVMFHYFEYTRAEKIVRAVSAVFLLAFYVCAVLLLLYTEWNASLLIVFLCVFVSTSRDKLC